jgi:hypothetical protein
MRTFKLRYPLVTICVLAIPILLSACSGHYGSLKKDHLVNDSFLATTVLPDHRYYFSGPESLPTAILGIRNGYELLSDQWTPFYPSETLLRKQVDSIRFHYRGRVRLYPYGSTIVDCRGNAIGVWYSIWDWTPVHCLGDNQINVYPPPLAEPEQEGRESGVMRQRF